MSTGILKTERPFPIWRSNTRSSPASCGTSGIRWVDGGHIVVATTRPETILGDTAIAVHPDDERYAGLIGRRAQVPALERQIRIIADDAVNPEFGSGAVKVTPGHDPNDYQMGIRHELEMINILNEDGTLNENAGPFAGQDRFEARVSVVNWLDEHDLIEKVEEHEHSVGHGQRSGTIIEPMLSEQWFVRTGPLAAAAAAAVRDGKIQFHPPRFADEFLRWMGRNSRLVYFAPNMGRAQIACLVLPGLRRNDSQ